MKKSQRLTPVMRFSAHKEQDAARSLSECRQQLQLQEQRLQELQHYRAEYVRRLQEAGVGGMGVAEMRNFQAFMDKLDQAVAQQQAFIGRLQNDFEQRKRQWLAARNRIKALDIVVDRYRSEEQRDEDRSTQKDQDDRAATKGKG